MKHLSFSQISCFNRCKKEYFYKYVQQLRPKQRSLALDFGKYFHLGTELLYKHKNPDIAMQVVYDQIEALDMSLCSEEQIKDQDWMKIVLNAMLHGYYDGFYSQDMCNGMKIIELEKAYTLPIRNPKTKMPSRTYNFKLIADAVFKDLEGRLWLVEYKTTSRLGDTYFDRLAVDHQITGNLAYLETVYKQPFEGVIYRIMKKPSIRQKQSESQEAFYERLQGVFVAEYDNYFIELVLTRTPDEINEFRQALWMVQKDIIGSIKNKWFYQNTTACSINNCSYLELCAKKPSAMMNFEQKEVQEEAITE